MRSKPTGLLLTALCLAIAPTAVATTWYVNGVSGSDSNNCLSASGACKTIGHAISLASSGDSIKVAAATYKENLTVGVSLKVIGAKAATTIINGGGVNTVVTISSTTAHVTISNVTITNGLAPTGGGMYNSGTLTVNNSVVSGNTAAHPSGCTSNCSSNGGGIYNNGTLTVNNSTVSGNTSTVPGGCVLHCEGAGGGIENVFGTVTINNSTVSNNAAAGGGGGIENGPGTVTINNSTVSNNTAYGGRGAGGGGILNSGTVTLNNTTVAYNSATAGSATGGGIENSSEPPQTAVLRVNNSTLAHNTVSGGTALGGGVYNLGGNVTVQNSIFAHNSPGGNCSGGVTSEGYNLSSDGTCKLPNTGDLNKTDPKLGPLQNNGGPTQTMALPSGSPAIDAGNPAGCTNSNGQLLSTDQRGMPRPDPEDSGGCDMGAFESQTD